ncbi:NAD(P)-dependent oxidoreductase [Brevibacterium sp. RIT 803]|uniref:NAD(P)-dependent oxidoreductase n=1 Tax=Brevibacterium sp. RIT 803 TaxID=2810210 RepID=UPI0019524F06|nr:NAD(P)-dependent oxidoreductase [Brevibacterium sp. RIT 803]MBM6592199.1 NAD(P)-dependent oxidoreductase [Brevibacterium sp. RIT 803]
MHILIFGASGHVGTGLAQHLYADHRITGIVRSQPEATTDYEPVVVPDWVDRPQAVIDELRRLDASPVDAVIAAVGGWYVDIAMIARGIASFDEDYSSYLRGHFAACVVSEALAEESEALAEEAGRAHVRHLALNGVASVEACVGSGAISVFGAAQEMLIRVAEAETDSVDYRELKIMAPIGGDDRNDLRGGVETISLPAVAEAASAVLTRPAEHEISTQLGV